jgi:hypothetical protein
MENRVEYDANGKLDEVVTDGGAHLERLHKNRWFLNCIRADGSSFAIWFTGDVSAYEEHQATGDDIAW